MTRVRFTAWRHVMKYEETEFFLELPDYVAQDQYAPNSIASAYIKAHEDELTWKETGSSLQKSGHRPIVEEKDTPIGDDGRAG